MSDNEDILDCPFYPRRTFAPEVLPCVYSTRDLTPKEIRFFEAIQNYDLSSTEAESSGFRYCGGDTHSRDINYYRMCFPEQPLPLKEETCVCEHPIKVNCYITNEEKTVLAVLGRCCIKKFLGGVARRCEQCGETHTNRTKNLCRVCIREYREREKKCLREEKVKLRERSREEKRLEKEREKEAIRLQREELKRQIEEWKSSIQEAREILKEYRSEYAKRRQWIPLKMIGIVKFTCPVCYNRKSNYPNTICGLCEKDPSANYSFDVIRLRLMILTWPIIKARKRGLTLYQLQEEVKLRKIREEEERQRQFEYELEQENIRKARAEEERLRRVEEEKLRKEREEQERQRVLLEKKRIEEAKRYRMLNYETIRKQEEAEYIRKWQLEQKQKAKENYQKKKALKALESKAVKA
jgi:hypothetical protein